MFMHKPAAATLAVEDQNVHQLLLQIMLPALLVPLPGMFCIIATAD